MMRKRYWSMGIHWCDLTNVSRKVLMEYLHYSSRGFGTMYPSELIHGGTLSYSCFSKLPETFQIILFCLISIENAPCQKWGCHMSLYDSSYIRGVNGNSLAQTIHSVVFPFLSLWFKIFF